MCQITRAFEDAARDWPYTRKRLQDYFIGHFGNFHSFILLFRPSRRVLNNTIFTLSRAPSPILQDPPRFHIGVSRQPRLITFSEWRDAHIGNLLGQVNLGTYGSYCSFLAYPHLWNPDLELRAYYKLTTGTWQT